MARSSKIIDSVRLLLSTEPKVNSIEYISIDSKQNMNPIEVVDVNGAVLSIAVIVGGVRLIDNVILGDI